MYFDPSRVDIFLNASVYAQIIERQIVKGQSRQPIVLSSKLGWLLTGNLSSPLSKFDLRK